VADSPHPVDNVAFTRPLVRDLKQHVQALAASMTTLLEERRHPVAASWVYMTALVAWAEDHGLVPMWLRAEADTVRKEYLAQSGAGTGGWLGHAFASLAEHPSTACLLDPRYTPLGEATPSEESLKALVDWWSTEAPEFAYAHDGPGPDSVTGWLVGDLLQALEDPDRKAAAFCQTPWWVADFLCELTLLPAAGAFAGERLRVIDPACGSGHILVWVAQGLYQIYTARVPGWPAASPVDAVRRIVDGLAGVELHPITAAVARLRLTVLCGAMLHSAGVLHGPLRLAGIPAWVRPRIAVGNALLAGLGDPCPPGTILDDTSDYPDILTRGTYHAVIANPPYKVERDGTVKDAIRRAYPEVCSGNFPLSVPFTKLLFDLALPDAPPPVVEQLDLFRVVA
jgi:hypothetical protein